MRIDQSARRTAFAAGLRSFADWLEQHPDELMPVGQRMLMPLQTNGAVVAFAARHGIPVTFDDEGNARADLSFGGVGYHVYGYVDFDAHVARRQAGDALEWAEQHGLELRPKRTAAHS